MTFSPDEETEALTAALAWHLDMGVDWIVDESPNDRFARYAAEKANGPPPTPNEIPPPDSTSPLSPASFVAPPPSVKPPAPARAEASLSTDVAARSAAELAAGAADLDGLKAIYAAFEGCSLKRGATQLVFSDGIPSARIMFIGEAPGAEEDRTGRPFVGRAGQLLDRMLTAVGLDRTSVYIANVIPWRPPGNRTPTPQEVAICMPFLKRQIGLANPDVIVALGGAAAQALFSLKDGIMRARGVWRVFDVESNSGPRTIDAIATLHPAYLLRSPAAKRLAWRDLREVRKKLDALPPR